MDDETVVGGVLEGPWEDAFWVRAPMTMRSKSNFRRAKRGTPQAKAWGDFKAFELEINAIVRTVRPKDWVIGEADAALNTRPAIIAVLIAKSTVDAANFSKSVLDACQGLVFVNDASVRSVSALAVRGRTTPFLLMAFARVDGNASLHELADAAASLQSQVLPLLP